MCKSKAYTFLKQIIFGFEKQKMHTFIVGKL